MAFVSSTILQKTLYIHKDMIIYTLLCVCSSYIYMLVNEGEIKKDDIRFCCIWCFRNFHRSYSGGSCRVAYINAIHKDCILPCFVVQGVANRCFLNSLCRITTKKSKFSITGPSGKILCRVALTKANWYGECAKSWRHHEMRRTSHHWCELTPMYTGHQGPNRSTDSRPTPPINAPHENIVFEMSAILSRMVCVWIGGGWEV